MKNRVHISTDCTSDLTPELIKKYDISVMYYYVITENGRFQDGIEISSDNLMEYMAEDGKEGYSDVASTEEYKDYFMKLRETIDGPIVHISMARHISNAYNIALEAAADMDNIYVVDSGHLSGGMAIAVLNAADLARRGAQLPVVLKEIKRDIERLCSSFIVGSTSYLNRNGKIGNVLHRICQILGLHPIILVENGKMRCCGIRTGKRKNYTKRYIRWALKNPKKIDTELAYIVSVGFSYESLEVVKKEVGKRVAFNNIIQNDASAAIATNCGPGSVGILYRRK